MKNILITNTHMNTQTQTAIKAKSIKLGIDVHADSYRVVRQIDHATPQPAQKFSPKEFLRWAQKQLTLAQEVYSCYEAGPFGYTLHRQLEKLGIHNVVVRPQDWDELHKGVKTDKTDALALAQRLSRYVDGNLKELGVIRVPTPEQEMARSQSRQREQLMAHRQRLEAQGRSLLLFNGHRIQGHWWRKHQWAELQPQLAAELPQGRPRSQATILGRAFGTQTNKTPYPGDKSPATVGSSLRDVRKPDDGFTHFQSHPKPSVTSTSEGNLLR